MSFELSDSYQLLFGLVGVLDLHHPTTIILQCTVAIYLPIPVIY
jgi:hypothetical protein